ncbi:MAG: carbohydrate binding domain-containing protein, partial [bacterium]
NYMKKELFLMLALAFIASSLPATAAGRPPAVSDNGSTPSIIVPSNNAVRSALTIDDFEDGKDITTKGRQPNWWKFDAVVLKTEKNNSGNAQLGKYYLNVSGQAKNWYVGGMGTYLGKDAAKFSNFSLDIEGQGEGSGIVKIELFEDDNRNYEVEQDKKFQPLYDDRFSYEVKVDWSGWQRVSIPFSDFQDTNPKQGDNLWNPDTKNGSGGLLHVQIIFVAGEETGSLKLNLDNIKLTKE